MRRFASPRNNRRFLRISGRPGLAVLEDYAMADRDLSGLAASAKIGGHPIHPMLVPFPIALLVATFICDVVYLANGNSFWADVSMWSLGAAIVMAALAALAGLTDFLGNARIRAIDDAWKHMIGNVVVVLFAVAGFWLRYENGSVEAVWPWGSSAVSRHRPAASLHRLERRGARLSSSGRHGPRGRGRRCHAVHDEAQDEAHLRGPLSSQAATRRFAVAALYPSYSLRS
jgi:uncharacterized membrane protein